MAPSKKSLAAYLTRWHATVKRGRARARTLESYEGVVRVYILSPPEGAPPIGSIRMDRIGSAAFEALYTHLWDAGLSPRTLQYLHAILRQALTHAVKVGDLVRNPTDGVRPPSERKDGAPRKKGGNPLTREEAERFLKAAQCQRHEALWTTLLTGGIRPGEAFALAWADVDLDGGRLHVRRSLYRPRGAGGWLLTEAKSKNARRTVVLPEMAIRLLRSHRARQAGERLLAGSEYVNHDFVFCTELGSPLDESNMHRTFKELLAAADVPDRRLYDLRHTCATLLLLAGEHPKIVSERLGHGSIALTLDTYSHILPTMQEGSALKLEAMFGEG